MLSDRTYIFSDEAGDFTFKDKPGASRYFIIGSVTMSDCGIGHELLSLRRELAWKGINLEQFHATTDKQDVRDAVYSIIARSSVRIDATVFDKRKAQPHLAADHVRFYKTAMYYHYRHIVPQVSTVGSELAVVASKLQIKKKKNAVHAAVRDVVKQVAHGRKFITSFTPGVSDPCLQVADYATWAVQRWYERDDGRSWEQIAHLIKSCYAIWDRGRTLYY